MMTVRRFNSLLLLALLTVFLSSVSGSSSRKVVGRAGENVTLPCEYNIKKHGPRKVCWGRGSIPYSGCNNQIIYTDGSKVTTRASSRYQLLGRLEDGDVSLTILNTTEEDAGWYGCRVQIPGWFNDEKHYIDLTIEKAPSASSTPRTRTTAQSRQTEQTTNTSETTEQTINASGQVTATESLPLSSNSSKAEPKQDDHKAGSAPVVLVCVLLALVTAGIVAFIGRRWNQHKIPQQQQQQQQQEEPEQMYSLIQFSSDPPAVELQNQGPAIENIYQNHSAGDAGGHGGGVYEALP